MDKEIINRLRKFRDIFTTILEFDYAYRARTQDVLPELDKKALKENPQKEIERLLNLMIERELAIQNKWLGLKKIILYAMKIKKLRNLIVEFLLELDLEKIKRDEADWYFCLNRNDYNYGGLSYEERMKIKEELDKKMGNKIPNIIFK